MFKGIWTQPCSDFATTMPQPSALEQALKVAEAKAANKKKDKAKPPSNAALIFESFKVTPNLREVIYTCTHDAASYSISVRFHEAMPKAWATAPPTGVLLGLGMAVISHVWTGFCTPQIIVRAGHLTKEEVQFWRDAYTFGLAEHFLINQIETLGGSNGLAVEIIVEAPPPDEQSTPPPSPPITDDPSKVRCLVPLGGGKDSATVLEMVKAAGVEAVVPFFLSDPAGEFASCWRYSALCELCNSDPVLIADFDWPTPNWRAHQNARRTTPNGSKWDDSARLWAALVAFASALAALMRGCQYVAVGNERSANLGNGVSWGGIPINHQHDKSHLFEVACHKYLLECGGPYFFSALQPFWDIQVVELFSRLGRKYVPYILSCNEPLDPDSSRWCARCEKCAFVYALLAAFLPSPQEAWAVFGEDMLQLPSCHARFEELIGSRGQTHWCRQSPWQQ